MADKKTKKPTEKKDKLFYEDIVSDVKKDFSNRATARKPLESTWQLNANFVDGNQYCIVDYTGEITDSDKDYYWQEREVYNHIAPIYETRLAKLGRVRPKMSVRPSSGDEEDIRISKMSGKILNSACHLLEMDTVTAKATMWSELCGSVFYKVTWNENGGRRIGKINDKEVYEGEVGIAVCPPYEIYPSSLSATSIDECESVIHAKAVSVEEIKRIYGKDVAPEDIDTFEYTPVSLLGGLGEASVTNGLTRERTYGYAMVIERYTKPTLDNPDGELVVVAGEQLLHYGGLPYEIGNDHKKAIPIVKQDAYTRPGCFFGLSVIERLVPIQRSYNAVKNRKHEFLNRISMGVLAVEDGSIDTNNLAEEGLSPGKILVYRQGSTPPRLMDAGRVPTDFAQEEDRLLTEFVTISGVSEIMRSSSTNSSSSGVAIQLLIEQDDTRLSVTAEYIKNAMRKLGQYVLRLYKQFALPGRLSRCVGDDGEVELMYWNKSHITCDDIVFDTENEISTTTASKQSMMFDLLKMGLLHDENGKLSDTMRYKVLDSLGYGGWDFTRDLESMNVNKACKENMEFKNKKAEVTEIDNHTLHILEHTKYLLSADFEKISAKNSTLKEKVLEHIREHKQCHKLENQAQGDANELFAKQG